MKNSQRNGAARPDKCAALRARIEHEIAWDDRTYHLSTALRKSWCPPFTRHPSFRGWPEMAPAETACLSDAISEQDLTRIARLEEQADALERRGRALLSRAGGFRDLAAGLRQFYADRVQKYGVAACVRQADDREWQKGAIHG